MRGVEQTIQFGLGCHGSDPAFDADFFLILAPPEKWLVGYFGGNLVGYCIYHIYDIQKNRKYIFDQNLVGMFFDKINRFYYQFPYKTYDRNIL